MTTALLVIDLQVGVLQDCFDAGGVVARSCALVERARGRRAGGVGAARRPQDLPVGSASWRLADGLVPAPVEPRVSKTFYDAFADTPLHALLEARGVRRLVIAGAQTDYCIRTTAQRAAAEGYAVVLASDAHTTTAAEFGGVMLSGEQIVAHTNGYFAGLRYPGVDVGIARHDAIPF
ncbi:isochorismatase family protein [Frateuria terrea]|uniref:Nicotinamidase-related amidase n=1 Tax=Frateuria terrea TaxID=529704 RepID=A0A1H6S4H9_9GAMM|nr:isochorismatase family protein [Frateuria terrea]SEI59697.1 Nicotinamidase-related amidase [Frateuria terrea]SFP21690.1 Nicotinamidase-related amidase [Frateuria terrea]